MQRMRSLVAVVVMASLALAGCVTDDTESPDFNGDSNEQYFDTTGRAGTLTKVEDRHTQDFNLSGPYSFVRRDAVYGILDGVGKTLTVDMPPSSGLPQADIHMGLFFPDIEGCDWESLMEEVDGSAIQSVDDIIMDEPCRLPVITDIGPYYGEAALGDVHATEQARRLGGFLIQNFVPQGYIVAQVSVTGTGDSTGCMDLMGPVEQRGVQAAVHYLGSAGFSNGAVAPIGRSYDGSTPYEAVMDGNPYVKTIVPISGLYGQMDLMWRNGSVESRGPGVLWALYYAFTYTGNDPVTDAAAAILNRADFSNPASFVPGPDDLNTDPERNALQMRQIAENALCPETQTGGAQAVVAYATGGQMGEARNTYWDDRSFDGKVLANYDGSVYFIHGMQDWNVDPHMAFPFYNQLERDRDVKGLFGQWGHHYPDRVSEHPENVRYDWAQDLLEWFDHYLKGTGPKPQLHVEMEDDHGNWRIESTWPPADVETLALGFDELTLVSGEATVSPAHPDVVLKLPVSDDETRIAGLPHLPITVTAEGAGGQIYAQLDDATTGVRLGHAIMDLRYHDGGDEMRVVTPGDTFTAMMEFFPMDVVVPAGHEITLTLSSTGRDYLPATTSAPVTIHMDGESQLKLPIIERDAAAFFLPPGATSE